MCHTNWSSDLVIYKRSRKNDRKSVTDIQCYFRVNNFGMVGTKNT